MASVQTEGAGCKAQLSGRVICTGLENFREICQSVLPGSEWRMLLGSGIHE